MAKIKYPAQIRYDEKFPVVAFRLDKETCDRLKAHSRLSGKSTKEILKESLVKWLDEKDGIESGTKKKGLLNLFNI